MIAKKNKLNIPILAFLIFFLSKEVFSYDGEKVVILCILSFIILAYFNFKDALYNAFTARTMKLKEEYTDLIVLKENLEKEIRKFWRIFLDLEDQLIEIYLWVKLNINSSIKKFNKNREAFLFYLIKDQMNGLLKEKLKLKQHLSNFILMDTIKNFKSILNNKSQKQLVYINDLNFYLNSLTQTKLNYTLIELVLNKLNINKEFCQSNNWINFNSYISAKYNILSA